jgi:hypothetical protein
LAFLFSVDKFRPGYFLDPKDEGSLIIVNKVKTKSVNISVYAKFQEPVPMPDFISYPIGNSCNLIISVMADVQVFQ